MASVTAAEPKKEVKSVDLVAALGEDFLALSKLLELVTELDIAQAWARGDIEFGRVKHCFTGRPGVTILARDGEPASTLLIEGDASANGIEWTGAKTPRHGKFRDLRLDDGRLPPTAKFKRYHQEVQVNREKDLWESLDDPTKANGREVRWNTAEINREEAAKLMVLYVRLTDKGLSALQG